MAITALPTPPSRQDPANFSDRADAFLGALPTFTTEANTLATDVNAKQVTASAAAITAVSAASAAALSEANAASTANFKGIWSSLTGALNKPASVSHNGTIWALLNNLANVALSQPGVTTDWVYVSGSGAPYTPTTALVTQAVVGGRYALTNATAQAAATNSLLYSDQLDNGVWTTAEVTVSANVADSPNGTGTADKLVETSATALHFILQFAYTAANVSRTLSFYAKSAGRSVVIAVMSRDDSFDQGFATYNLSTGIVSGVVNTGTGTGATGSMEHVGNGWYLCTLTVVCSTSVGTAVRSLIYVNSGSPYLGDGVSGVLFAGMQNELGSVATSRIPTLGTAVTRLAGVIAPQRIILPASPATNTQVDVLSANTVDTNIIDPNGQQFYGTNGALSGAMRLDSKNAKISLQFINNFWRAI